MRAPTPVFKSGRMLPRLAYIGDVPVSATSGGMLLLYRLLEGYPPERLVVFEATASPRNGRLERVEYCQFFGALARLRRTRFHRAFTSLAVAVGRLGVRGVASQVRGRGVEAILSVTHGTSWLVADGVASELGIPLILLNHDYWFDTCPARWFSAQSLHDMFGRVYRRARLRFCISPQMEEYYRVQYGASGTVLYPSRAASAPWANSPPEPKPRTLIVAYAGTVAYKGYRGALQAMARALVSVGGALVLYANLSGAEAASIAGDLRNVSIRDFVPSTEIVDLLRGGADVVFLPMTSAMGLNARLSFPSKLADYAATGLPIIVYGPKDSSAYCWAKENPSAAIAVPEGDEAALLLWIQRLSSDSELRRRIGTAALEVGRKYFDGKVAQGKLIEAIACIRT